jgi:hypothetical protein
MRALTSSGQANKGSTDLCNEAEPRCVARRKRDARVLYTQNTTTPECERTRAQAGTSARATGVALTFRLSLRLRTASISRSQMFSAVSVFTIAP